MSYSTLVDRIPFGDDVFNPPTGVQYQVNIPGATLTDGYTFEMRIGIGNANTVQVPSLQVNALGFKSVVGTDYGLLQVNDLQDGLIYLFVYSATFDIYQCLGLTIHGGGTDIQANAIFVDAIYGNDGTGQPFNFSKKYQTIQAAINVSSPGDVIYVMPGDYPESTNLIGTVDNLSFYFSPDTNMTGVVIDSSGQGGGGAITCKVYGYGNFFGTTSIINLNSAGNVFVECNKLEQIAGSFVNAPIKMRGNDTLEVICNYMKTIIFSTCIRIEASGNSKSFITVREEMLGMAVESNFGSGSVPYLKLVANRITNNFGGIWGFIASIFQLARGDMNIYCNDIKDNSIYFGNGNDKYVGSVFYPGGNTPFLTKVKIYGNMVTDNVAGVWVNQGSAGSSFEWYGNITTPNSCVLLTFNDGTGPINSSMRFNGYFKGTKPPVTVGGISVFELRGVGAMKLFVDGTIENLLPDLAGISKSNDPANDVILGLIRILTTVSVGTAPALNSITALDTYKTIQVCARQQPNINMTNSIVGSVDYVDPAVE